jgi:hypothetical protein
MAFPEVACGVVWSADGRGHAIGFGYVSWPIADPNGSAVVRGIDVFGAAILATKDTMGVTVGYSRERTVTLDEDRIVSMDCLECDLADARLGGGTVRKTMVIK